jgi:hypothetical protein
MPETAEIANRNIREFINKLRKCAKKSGTVKDFKYVYITTFIKNGYVHRIVTNTDGITITENVWKYRYCCHQHKILAEDIEHMARYMAKDGVSRVYSHEEKFPNWREEGKQMPECVVNINANISNLDETIEKAKLLKSLLEEVKESASSLNLNLTVNGKPISGNHQKDD